MAASMSSSEAARGATELADCLARASAALAIALEDPGQAPDAALQNLLRSAVRLYAAKAEAGMRSPFPPHCVDVSVDDVMILATDMMHALNVQVFELSMWQAMTGNCIAPNQRTDSST
jgi:hypothetical protein